jgi:hypothetical protein
MIDWRDQTETYLTEYIDMKEIGANIAKVRLFRVWFHARKRSRKRQNPRSSCSLYARFLFAS